MPRTHTRIHCGAARQELRHGFQSAGRSHARPGRAAPAVRVVAHDHATPESAPPFKKHHYGGLPPECTRLLHQPGRSRTSMSPKGAAGGACAEGFVGDSFVLDPDHHDRVGLSEGKAAAPPRDLDLPISALRRSAFAVHKAPNSLPVCGARPSMKPHQR